MEARFLEAIIAYHKHETDRAIQILDELIQKEPEKKEYLEMKALTLKGTQSPEKTLEVYQRLYSIAAEADKGPYAYELGTVLTQLNRQSEAKPYFQKSIELHFNPIASHFYLGLGAFQQNNFIDAEKQFEIVAESDLVPFNVTGKYYLGICYLKLKNGSQGIQELVEVQHLTADSKPGEAVHTISEATEKMLVPFSKSQTFGNILFQTQYDSNVQQLPAGASNPVSGNNPSSLKLNLAGGGGYMTAPLNPIQWVFGYRMSYNYNLNRDTKGFEFFSNQFSVFANYHSLERTSTGLKMDGSFTFQNALSNPNNTQSSYQYQKYNSTIGAGPYVRHQLNRELRIEGELGVHKQNYYIDSQLSGTRWNGAVSLRSDRRDPYLNPGAHLTLEKNSTSGDSFYSSSYGVGLMNGMNLPNSLSVYQSFDFLFTGYSRNAQGRSDHNYTFRVNAAKFLSPKLSLLGDFSYTANLSTVSDVYTYHQVTTSFGVGYSL